MFINKPPPCTPPKDLNLYTHTNKKRGTETSEIRTQSGRYEQNTRKITHVA